MYLKSLVLQGFKSFANRVELNFLPGVAAVVGPNGSGKSNIADAIRWVLGEHSIRTLRGVRVQDIIFSGSDARRPLGMAEVSITLDNSAGELPLEFSEVTVTRRVFRSGESQFYINKTPCRLRDIQELFLDSGIGRGSLSLIGQGEVDAVLSASPEDRRLLLEDAAGITRYRTRKEEALEKLEQTADDLLRVNDVITEVTGWLEPLARAAELAQRHADLTKELEELESKLYGHEWARLDRQRQAETSRHATATKEAEEISARIARLEEERVEQEIGLKDALQALEASREALQSAREHEQNLLHSGELALERRAQTERELQRAMTAKAVADANSNDTQQELTGAQERLVQYIQLCEQAQDRLNSLQTEHSTLDQRIKSATQSLEVARTELAKAERTAALWEGELRSSEGESGHAGSRRDRLAEQRAAYAAQRAQAEEARDQSQGTLSELDKEILTIKQATAQNEELQKESQTQQTALERSVANHGRRYNELESRRRVLSDMASSYEGYFQGVRNVLATRHEFGDGVLGSIGELIRVPQELDLAMETALGSALQNVVTRTERDAEAAVAFLKRTKGGRATFLPLAALRFQVFTADEKSALTRHPDVVGVASDLISYEKEIQPAVAYLLGRTVVTKTLHGALQVSKQLRAFQRIVSLEGDLVTPGGAITGGSAAGRSSGILARGRELEDLQKTLTTLAGEGTTLERQLATARQDYEARRVERENLANRLHEAEVARAGVSRDEVAREAELQRLAALEQSLDEEERLVGEHDRSLAERRAKAQEELTLATAAKAKWVAAAQELEQQVAIFIDTENKLRDSLTRARVETAEVVQKRDATNRDVTRLHATLDDNQAHAAHEQQLAQAALQVLEGMKAEASEREAAIEQARLVSASAAAGVEAARAQVEALRQAMNTVNLAEKEARQSRDIVMDKLHRAEVALARIQAAIGQVEEKLTALGVAPQQPDGPLDLPAAKRQAESLRQQIADLGPVNPGAMQELADTQERYKFLCNQRDDLLAAKQRLEETIAEIDQTSTRRLKETYEKVSQSFAQVFQRLFAGGQANLVWTDEAQMLDAGLELMVQPPGKKMQSLMALSGGERALTAIALLFAILDVRPSPFCVLDEIDAALDEQNVSRFSSLLTDFAQKSQFVVITHRQATMEAADILYGVTMDRTAASELVSLQLAALADASAEAAATID